jgi:hypothetical protein
MRLEQPVVVAQAEGFSGGASRRILSRVDQRR